MKKRGILIAMVVALFSSWVLAHAEPERQIYPLPATETEDVVIQWFQRLGYQLRRSTMENHVVSLFAKKGKRSWHVTLWPHSPLATRVAAVYTIDGKDASSGARSLWSLLDDYLNNTSAPTLAANRAVPEVVMSKADSVVCIYVGDPQTSLQISGFIIDRSGLIVCTAHGLKNLNHPLTVILSDGRELSGRLVKIDKKKDLSLVAVKTKLETTVDLSGGRDLTGEPERLFNIGCATNSHGFVYSGSVSGPPRKSNRQVLWQVNMQIRPGSSGSPVFDQQGNLVAVVKGRYRGAETIGFLIPYASLKNFMSDYSK